MESIRWLMDNKKAFGGGKSKIQKNLEKLLNVPTLLCGMKK